MDGAFIGERAIFEGSKARRRVSKQNAESSLTSHERISLPFDCNYHTMPIAAVEVCLTVSAIEFLTGGVMVVASNDFHLTYLTRAAECRVKAEMAMSEVARIRYLESAERWKTLAMSYVEAPKFAGEVVEQIDFRRS